MRVALYGRYSRSLQNALSVDDQFAVCEERCAAEGWTIVRRYSDRAMSGSSMSRRTGLLELMEAAKRGEFDMVVAESLDRLSRNMEETAGFYTRLKFAGVAIYTLAEARVSEIHVGFKGTMNAIDLQHTAARVRRGQQGSVRRGKVPGGKAYGYRTVRTTENPTGLREIVEQEAEVIREIFAEYNAGISPDAIAKRLNAEGVPSPTGREWRASTINGSRKRNNGILRNALYVGEILWGRNYNVRDPETGMRVTRSNDPSQFVSGEVSDELKASLRIIDDKTWAAAQSRLSSTGRQHLSFRKRPRHLLSGLVRCEKCGGPMTIENRDRMLCSNHKNKGTCTISYSIAREEVERRVIEAIATKLSDSGVLEAYRDEYVRERKAKSVDAVSLRPALLKRQADLKAKLDRLVERMGSEELIPAAMTVVTQQINKTAADLQIVETELAQTPDAADMTLPSDFAERLSRQLPNLRQSLQAESQEASLAREILRGMIEEVRVRPTPGKESRIECPWDLTITGPFQAVLEMPDIPDFARQMSPAAISPFARRGLMVPLA